MNRFFFLHFFKIFKFLLIFILAILFIRTFVVEPGKVNGRSMEPTFMDNDLFFINKFSLLFTRPKRGQIIQLYEPNSQTIMLKRIIGVPGDTIIIKKNKIYISNDYWQEIELPEIYLKPNIITRPATDKPSTFGPIPDDYYFVLGDNRAESIDSRDYGLISRRHINGAVFSFPAKKNKQNQKN